MGYYSALDIQIQGEQSPAVPPRIEFLRGRLDVLWERLEDLLRWSEDPEFHDRYFYSDHITEAYELPGTVQGAVDAIRTVNQELDELNVKVRNFEHWMESVRTTGATPDGQFVISVHIFPVSYISTQAA